MKDQTWRPWPEPPSKRTSCLPSSGSFVHRFCPQMCLSASLAAGSNSLPQIETESTDFKDSLDHKPRLPRDSQTFSLLLHFWGSLALWLLADWVDYRRLLPNTLYFLLSMTADVTPPGPQLIPSNLSLPAGWSDWIEQLQDRTKLNLNYR